jgi:hypothetical protein
MWRTCSHTFGAPQLYEFDKRNLLRLIRPRLNIKWISAKNIPKSVRFIGEGETISARDLDSFMSFMEAHLVQYSLKLAEKFGYVFFLPELSRGIVNITLEPKDEHFGDKTQEWQFIRLLVSDVFYDFNGFGTSRLNFDQNNRRTFTVAAREQYPEYSLQRFETTTVEQKGSEFYAKEVDATVKKNTIEAEQYVSRAFAEAAGKTGAFYIQSILKAKLVETLEKPAFEMFFDTHRFSGEELQKTEHYLKPHPCR